MPYEDVIQAQIWAVDFKHSDSNKPGESAGRCPHESGRQNGPAAQNQPGQQPSRDRILQTAAQTKQASRNKCGLFLPLKHRCYSSYQ